MAWGGDSDIGSRGVTESGVEVRGISHVTKASREGQGGGFAEYRGGWRDFEEGGEDGVGSRGVAYSRAAWSMMCSVRGL